jgi:hypothetical protein
MHYADGFTPEHLDQKIGLWDRSIDDPESHAE